MELTRSFQTQLQNQNYLPLGTWVLGEPLYPPQASLWASMSKTVPPTTNPVLCQSLWGTGSRRPFWVPVLRATSCTRAPWPLVLVEEPWAWSAKVTEPVRDNSRGLAPDPWTPHPVSLCPQPLAWALGASSLRSSQGSGEGRFPTMAAGGT